MAFRLSVEDGPYVQTIEVRAGALIVGRRPPGGLVLSSPGLADRHAVLRQAGDRVEVLDQKTRIGMRLNGERVERAVLAKGDSIQIGWARISVMDVTADAAAPVPVAAAAAPATVELTPRERASLEDSRPAAPVVTPFVAPEEQPTEFVVLSRRTIRVLPWWGISVAIHAILFGALALLYPGRSDDARPAEQRFSVNLRTAAEIWPEDAAVVEPSRPSVEVIRPDMTVPADASDPLLPMSADPRGAGGTAPHVPKDEGIVLDDPLGGVPWAKTGGSSGIGVGVGGVRSPAPGTSIGPALDEVFGKEGAGRANAAAAGRLTGEPFTRALVEGLRLRTNERNVKVVRSDRTRDYDQGEDVMETLGLGHGILTPEQINRVGIEPEVRAVFWNCSGHEPPPRAIARLSDWVMDGGFLFTSDWGIEKVVEQAFPGFIRPLRRGPKTVMTPEETVGFTVAPGRHTLLAGLPPEQETARWWLEDSSIPFVIENAEAVELLIVSSDLEQRHGSKNVAVTFPFGRGRVVHVLGHMYQKEGNLRGAYAMQRLLLNFLYQAIRR